MLGRKDLCFTHFVLLFQVFNLFFQAVILIYILLLKGDENEWEQTKEKYDWKQKEEGEARLLKDTKKPYVRIAFLPFSFRSVRLVIIIAKQQHNFFLFFSFLLYQTKIDNFFWKKWVTLPKWIYHAMWKGFRIEWRKSYWKNFFLVSDLSTKSF